MNGNTRSTADWKKWYNGAKDEEKEIYNLICEYKNYFNDLTLQEDSCTFTIFENKSKLNIQVFFDNLVVHVEEFKNPEFLACYSPEDHIITVSPLVKTEEIKFCILHEMIHIFDKVYDRINVYGVRDAVRWRLYYDLREKINGLDQAIFDFTKIISLMTINRSPENPRVFRQRHDTLFLLKSFDLDMKMDYPFGTVLGYGYTDKFKYLEKN